MLHCANLRLRYPHQERDLLAGVTFSLQRGELLFLRGSNGCGKTSLLNIISGIIPVHVKAQLAGSLTLDGQDLRAIPLNERFRYLAYQMSDPDTQIFFPNLGKELAFALENLGLPVSAILPRINAAAEFFGLAGLLRREPATLSYGQKKLLLFAICASLESPLILLDEPSAALSETANQLLAAWVRNCLNAGRSLILADHNPTLAEMANQILDLDS